MAEFFPGGVLRRLASKRGLVATGLLALLTVLAQAQPPTPPPGATVLGGGGSVPSAPPAAAPARFESLASAARLYGTLSRQAQWQPIPDGPLLRLGDRHPQILRLRATLRLYGDLPVSADAADTFRFDAALAQALRRFQRRHHTLADGILGPDSRQLLNVSPARRAAQLAINVRRQARFDPARRYVWVNLPEYRARLMDSGRTLLQMKTIIGETDHPTPELSSRIDRLVINPDWNVPEGIAFRDILPRWQKDPSYLARNNLQLVTGWGWRLRPVPVAEFDPQRLYHGDPLLRFWQSPGPGNALGQIKFQFPNAHMVYLHDTPQRWLFAARTRAFSAGCVRLERPLDLARALLNEGSRDGVPLATLLATGQTLEVPLTEAVAVHLTYWTAWLDEEGVLHFVPDIYQRDQAALASALP